MQKGIVRPLGVITSAGLLPLFFVALPGTLAAHAGSNSPVQYCRRVVNDDALRHPPGSLIPAIRRLFGAKEGYERETSYYRCGRWWRAALQCGRQSPLWQGEQKHHNPRRDGMVPP